MNFKIKTLLVTLEFPPQIGGVASYYENLCRKFLSEDIEVLTLAINQNYRDDKNYCLYRRKFFINWLYPKWLPLFWLVGRLIKKRKIKQLWVGQVLPVGTVCLILSKIFRIPYLVSAHGLDILRPQASWRKKQLLKLILKRADLISANSQFTKDKLIELGVDAHKIEVIFPEATINKQVDEKHVKELKIKWGLTNQKIILTVARLVERKGHVLILTALKELEKDFSNFVYLIVGDGPLKAALQKNTAELGLSDKVIFTGFVSKAELPCYYALCDVFVLTPQADALDSEGFGIVYLEARQFDKPIIASRVGGVGEALTAYPLKDFVDNDINSLTVALKKIINRNY